MENLLFVRRILITVFLTAIMMLGIYSSSNAIPLSKFTSNGWTQFANDDGYNTTSGFVGPGFGGQRFDTEHLFYKLKDNILSIGLQTGFNLDSGIVKEGSIYYYAGDLALSFDGNSSNYEYAADFGLYTQDYKTPSPVGGNTGHNGYDTAGLYKVNSTTGWNNDVWDGYGASRPFAMQSGELIAAFDSSTNLAGRGNPGSYYDTSVSLMYGGYSFYRIISFPTALLWPDITPGSPINLSAHWTMSCGNDVINGTTSIPNPIPEPGTMFLLGSLATGLFGFAGLRKRFTR